MGWLEGIQFGCLNNLAPQFDEMEDYTYTLMRLLYFTGICFMNKLWRNGANEHSIAYFECIIAFKC